MSNLKKKSLPADRILDALAAIRAAHQNPDSPVTCPLCSEPGLVIEDRSARPHAEWYALSCKSCGLDDTIHIPMGSAQRIPG